MRKEGGREGGRGRGREREREEGREREESEGEGREEGGCVSSGSDAIFMRKFVNHPHSPNLPPSPSPPLSLLPW